VSGPNGTSVSTARAQGYDLRLFMSRMPRGQSGRGRGARSTVPVFGMFANSAPEVPLFRWSRPSCPLGYFGPRGLPWLWMRLGQGRLLHANISHRRLGCHVPDYSRFLRLRPSLALPGRPDRPAPRDPGSRRTGPLRGGPGRRLFRAGHALGLFGAGAQQGEVVCRGRRPRAGLASGPGVASLR
jgi:hypothetical protein